MRLELTRKGDYAIRAVVALARHAPDLVPAPRLAEETAIPRRFVGQVMTDLVQAGIVETRLGRAGGYRLATAPGDLNLLEVVQAVEGNVRRRSCVLRDAPCQRDGACDVHEVFSAAQDALLAELAEATIASIVARSAGSADS